MQLIDKTFAYERAHPEDQSAAYREAEDYPALPSKKPEDARRLPPTAPRIHPPQGA
jgi:hypothetical protein